MNGEIIIIDFTKIHNHDDVIKAISKAFLLPDELVININLNSKFSLYSDHLLLIICLIKHLRTKNINITGNLIDFDRESDRTKYASRVDFFKHLEFDFPEPFYRNNSTGRFTEISAFNSNNVMELFNDIMKILIVNEVNQDMLIVLNFCLMEVLDNTLNHSGEGFTYGAGSGMYVLNSSLIRKKSV